MASPAAAASQRQDCGRTAAAGNELSIFKSSIGTPLSVDASDLAPFAANAAGKERATRLEIFKLPDSGGDTRFWLRRTVISQS